MYPTSSAFMSTHCAFRTTGDLDKIDCCDQVAVETQERDERHAARIDRPWHHLGAARYAVARLAGILDPPVTVVQPSTPMITDRDVPVASRDGTMLRVNC
jgi:hypothetical protein